nr:MAG TPA: hypothetical protein [Caudoviricetes sp.]
MIGIVLTWTKVILLVLIWLESRILLNLITKLLMLTMLSLQLMKSLSTTHLTVTLKLSKKFKKIRIQSLQMNKRNFSTVSSQSLLLISYK